jgi:ribonucleotide monophosphatase NagD (HAD superfamily)
MATALVLTGVTTRETLQKSDIRPDFVWESVAEILREEKDPIPPRRIMGKGN